MAKKQRTNEIKDLKTLVKDLKKKLEEAEKGEKKQENGIDSSSVVGLLTERERSTEEKTELHNRSDLLRNEKKNVEIKKFTALLRTGLEALSTNANQGQKMLKSMSSLVCGLENNIGAQTRERGLDSYSVEVEGDKKEFGNLVESLKIENNSLKKQMEITLFRLSDKEKQVEKLLQEKKELAGVQKNVDNDLTKTCEKLTEKVRELNDSLALAEVERDNVMKSLDEERKRKVAHEEKIVESEKMIESTSKELERFKSDKERLIKENKDLEDRSNILRDDKCLLHKEIADLKEELESCQGKANHDLAMLKSVSSLVCGLENGKGEHEQDKGIDSYSAEIEAIKKVFENKENMIEKFNIKVRELDDDLALVEVGRDNAQNVLDETKRNEAALKEKIVELEKMIDASGKDLEIVESERVRLIKEMKELENEKSILQKDIVERQRAMDVLKTDLESAKTIADHSITMLESMSSLVCEFENKIGEPAEEMRMDP